MKVRIVHLLIVIAMIAIPVMGILFARHINATPNEVKILMAIGGLVEGILLAILILDFEGS